MGKHRDNHLHYTRAAVPHCRSGGHVMSMDESLKPRVSVVSENPMHFHIVYGSNLVAEVHKRPRRNHQMYDQIDQVSVDVAKYYYDLGHAKGMKDKAAEIRECLGVTDVTEG